MNKAILAFFAAFLLVTITGIGLHLLIEHRQQDAIVRILNQEIRAREEMRSVAPRPRPSMSSFSARVPFRQRLEQISTEGCPQDFRLAWLDYVQTFERSADTFSALGTFAEFSLAIVKPSGQAARDAMVRFDKMDVPEARRRLQKVALIHGVEIIGR